MRLRRPQVPKRYDTQRDHRYLYIPVHRGARAGMHIDGNSRTNQVISQDTEIHSFSGNLH